MPAAVEAQQSWDGSYVGDPHKQPEKKEQKAWYHTNHPAVVFPVMAAWSLVSTYMCELGWKDRLIALYMGMMWESWLEFAVHRWVLHFPLWWPWETNPRLYYVTHGHHHVYPNRRQFFPLLHNQLLTAFSLLTFYTFMSKDWVWGVSAGGSFGLIVFELIHAWIHRGINQWWLKPMETFHIYHHRKDKHNSYGFVMPTWDWIFGSCPDNFPYIFVPIPFPVVPFIAMALIQELRGGPGAHLKNDKAAVDVDAKSRLRAHSSAEKAAGGETRPRAASRSASDE